MFEYLLKNKPDAVKANDDGLMTINDKEEDFEQDDEATITRIQKLNAKLEQLKDGCTRRSQWTKSMAAIEQSIDAKKN